MECEKVKERNAKILEEKKKSSNDFVTEVSKSREISDIYLRHPANESSSDDEGEELPAYGSVNYIH